MKDFLFVLSCIGLISCSEPDGDDAAPSPGGADARSAGAVDLSLPNTPDMSLEPPAMAPARWDAPLVYGSASLEQALGVDALPDHRLVIAGRSEGQLPDNPDNTLADGFIALIQDGGELAWIKQFGSPATDQFLDVVYHPQGLIFAGGFSTGDFAGQNNQRFVDGTLVALTVDGETQWEKLLDLGSVNRLLSTPSGIVVLGSYEEAEGDAAAFIAEYDLSGERRWLKTLNSPAYDSATSAVLMDETIYLCGFSFGALTSAADREDADIFVAALSLTGELLWVREYGSEGDDSPVRIVSAPQGLIIAGYTSGLFGEQQYGGNDVAVLKIDRDGEPLWRKQFGTAGSEAAYGLAISPEGHIILSGRIDEGSWGEQPNLGGDAFLLELSQEGQLLRTRQYDYAGRDEIVDLAFTQSQLNIAGYLGGSAGAEDLDIFVDRLADIGEPRGSR